MKPLRPSLFVVIAAIGLSASSASAETLTLDNFRDFEPFHWTIDSDEMSRPLLEAAIFLVTNEQRVAHGLSPIGMHASLGQAARLHAERMVDHDFYAHHDPTDARFRSPTDRARYVGIANPGIAENIHNIYALQYDGSMVYKLEGRGQFSHTPRGPAIPMHTYLSFAEAVVADWMDSPGHRANILNNQARQLGVGVAFYWNGDWPYFKAVQNFQMFRDVITDERAGRPDVEPAPREPAPRDPAPSRELPEDPPEDISDELTEPDSGCPGLRS